jgi:acid phosphatase (class A)
MHTRTFLAPLFCLTLLISMQLRAADPKYLTPARVPDGIALLPAPPERGSAEDREDAEMAFRVYSTRTPEQFALGKDENKLNVFKFARFLGPWFQPEKCPKTEALFKQVELEARIATSVVKGHFKRLRPCNAEPERFAEPIEPTKTTNNGTSFYTYPSGTTTRSTIYAFLLVELFPEKRDALLAKARESGWLRVQGGVHYPTDVFAGRVWGQALARAFLASPEFQHDFAEVKAELAAGRQLTQ